MIKETKTIPLRIVARNDGQLDWLPKNPRQWTKEDIYRTQLSIEEDTDFLEDRPLLLVPDHKDGRFIVFAGNLRREGAKAAGLMEVPCVVYYPQNDEDKVTIKRRAMKDNGSFGSWDFDLLANEWDDLPLTDWGVPAWDAEPEKEKPAITEDEFNEDDGILVRCNPGDIWQLGDHRLMCGDSTDAVSVGILLNGEKADLVFTDPPYGMKKESEGVLNDNLNQNDLLGFNKKWIPITINSLKEDGSWYCWGTDEPLMDIYGYILRPMIEQRKIMFRNLITWDKGNGQGQNSPEFRMYPIADEKCLFVMMGARGFYSFKDFKIPFHQELLDRFKKYNITLEEATNRFRKFQKESDNESSAYNSSYSHLKNVSMFNFPKREYWVAWFGSDEGYDDYKKRYEDAKLSWRDEFNYFDNTHDNMNNVWHFARTSQDERFLTGGHATPKPIALCGRAIKSSSRVGEIVLDVFGGSGSTLIACEQLGRKCYMMELDPHYCDVIIARWEKLTGKVAQRITEGGKVAQN